MKLFDLHEPNASGHIIMHTRHIELMEFAKQFDCIYTFVDLTYDNQKEFVAVLWISPLFNFDESWLRLSYALEKEADTIEMWERNLGEVFTAMDGDA